MNHKFTFLNGGFSDLANEKLEIMTCMKFASAVYECVLHQVTTTDAVSGIFYFKSYAYRSTTAPTGMVDDTVPYTNLSASGSGYTLILD